MGIGGQVTAVAHEARSWVKGEATTGAAAVGDSLIFADGGHKVRPTAARRKKGLILLAERLCTQKGWLGQELRDVGPMDVTVARDDPPAKWILRRDRKRDFVVCGG